MHVLTARRAPNSAYGQIVARAIDTQIGVSAASLSDSPFFERHTEGLRSLRDLVQSLSGEHPQVYALWVCQNYGLGDSDGFDVGEDQSVFLSTLGMTGDLDSQLPDAGELLAEFVTLGFCDAFARQADAINKRPVEAIAAESAQVREAHDRAEQLEEQNASLTAALSSTEAENADLSAQLANLKRLVAATAEDEQGNGSKPRPQSPKRKVRRTKPSAATTTTRGDN